jgi:DNA (cytosine-5)-methyltransferase 1
LSCRPTQSSQKATSFNQEKIKMSQFTSLEMCAGAGGQALGLEMAGFDHSALVELEPAACATLRLNRPAWNVIEGDLRLFSGAPYKAYQHYIMPQNGVGDLRLFSGAPYKGIDLLAGGVPCPPFSKAGKQLGAKDERDLFPEAIRLVDECRPQAVMLENVRGLLDAVFDDYRNKVEKQLKKLGYVPGWRLLNASDYGVSQLRPRVVFVGIRKDLAAGFSWPEPLKTEPPTVGELLHDLMKANGWRGADRWREQASTIAPTLVGGSKKHGGPDLGPTRAKRAWAALGVDGMGLWDEAPPRDFVGMPRLMPRMTARIQGFPDDWQFSGRKTAAYRQIGNAFPPPVAAAVARQIFAALSVKRIFKVA